MAGARPARDQREWIQIQERKDAQTMRAVRRMVSGLKTDIIEGNVGTPAPPVPVDSRTPTAPIEVQYDSALYIGLSGQWEGRLVVDFPDVVKATDGTDIEVEVYELWGFKVEANYDTAYPGTNFPDNIYPGADRAFGDDPSITYTLVAQHSQSSFRTDGFIPGDQWRFRVRAVSKNGFYGLWSTQFSMFFIEDDSPPDQPMPPVANALRGVISITHDGMAVTGPMPADFKYLVLAGGTASSPVTEIARWGRNGGQHVLADIPYYQVWHFRVRAVDESGNYSPWSESVIAYTTPLVDRDIILSELDAATTHLKNINAGVSILENTIIAEHLVATEKLTAKFAQFLTVKADMIDVNSLWTDELFVGVADAVLVRSDMFVGKFFDGGEFRGTTFRTNREEFRGIVLDENGLSAYNRAGQQTVRIDAANGDFTATYGTLTGLNFQTSLPVRTGIKIDPVNGLRAYDDEERIILDIGGSIGTNKIVGTLATNHAYRPRVELANETNHGLPAIFFFQGNHPGTSTGHQSAVYLFDNEGQTELILRGVYTDVMPVRPPGAGVSPGVGFVTAVGNFRVVNGYGNPQEVNLQGWTKVVGRHDNVLDRVDIQADTLFLTTGVAGMTGGGEIVIDSGPNFATRIVSAYERTTTAGVNVHVAPNGALFRSTSASRRKIDQRVIDIPDSILDVEMKDWFDRGELEAIARLDGKPSPLMEADQRESDALVFGKRYAGWIAEDVEKAGGGQFIQRGPEGLIEGIEEARFVGAQVQVLTRRLEEMASELKALKEARRGGK